MEKVYSIDAITGKEISLDHAVECVINYIDERFVKGYTETPCKNVRVYLNGCWCDIYIPIDFFKEHTIFHNGIGGEVLDYNMPLREIVLAQYSKTNGYPYSFGKKYEAVDNFKLFAGKQKILNNEVFELSKYLRYSFGLEYETSLGIIPEDICFRDGLIPLRDGSISGNEYSTVVMYGNEGLNLMYQQLQTLRKYTRFDKECSLHIHMGGFPLKAERILSLYNLCTIIQKELKSSLPAWTFYTAKYKASQKDYCKLLERSYNTFEELYGFLTGSRFFGDLNQPHPNDIDRARKWQIPQRYYWANVLNLICYKVNKTMEFRMLRPTYNLEKILFWIYVFNGIMIYAEANDVTPTSKVALKDVLSYVYPPELTRNLLINFYKAEVCCKEQERSGDYIGARIDIENEFFNIDGRI
jgi:hypothetical protein